MFNCMIHWRNNSMGAKLYKQFQDFHNTIKLDKETSQLKEKRETLQTDIKNKLPQN